MSRVTDQNDGAALIDIPLPLHMNLRDQRTGGVEHRQATTLGLLLDMPRDPVSAEDRDCAGRHLRQLFHEARALVPQTVDDMPVVHDFVPHVHRRAVLFERPFDDLDCAHDAGTVAARLSQNHFHYSASAGRFGPLPLAMTSDCKGRRPGPAPANPYTAGCNWE